jgi:coenzyme F420-dependent glucose-6-phosphate dehydrogenase
MSESPVRFFHFCSHEQFPPQDLLEQAIAAERAGFDGITCSDHLQPWWEGGESGHAWVWLGAAGQATEQVALGTGVTPPGPRYHPVLIAQAWATLELLFPGRPYLGIGSGESLNESPLGADWPPVGEQIERLEEGLQIIRRLLAGETIDHDGKHFSTKQARLHSRPERIPPIYVSAFGPQAAEVAGRLGDGVWTLGDPESAPEIVEAYRAAAADAGREPGEVVLQGSFSWAESGEAALESARVWKGAQPMEFFRDDWHDPGAMYEEGERQVSDDELREAVIVASDPEDHVERIRQLVEMGATIVPLQNSSPDPIAAIGVYGEDVLPALREVRA